jgi:hypothetical protein
LPLSVIGSAVKVAVRCAYGLWLPVTLGVLLATASLSPSATAMNVTGATFGLAPVSTVIMLGASAKDTLPIASVFLSPFSVPAASCPRTRTSALVTPSSVTVTVTPWSGGGVTGPSTPPSGS